jgi:hypothetical protein
LALRINLKGVKTNELAIKKDLFKLYEITSNWKIVFKIKTNSNATGLASMLFVLNSLPSGGKCFYNLNKGMSLATLFEISCSDWTDSDGSIEKYEFYGKNII